MRWNKRAKLSSGHRGAFSVFTTHRCQNVHVVFCCQTTAESFPSWSFSLPMLEAENHDTLERTIYTIFILARVEKGPSKTCFSFIHLSHLTKYVGFYVQKRINLLAESCHIYDSVPWNPSSFRAWNTLMIKITFCIISYTEEKERDWGETLFVIKG